MSLMEHMIAHMQHRRVPTFPPLPPQHQPTYAQANTHFTHGQFATSSATLLSIPSEHNNHPSYVILRIRILLAQGYYHNAIRVLYENVEVIDEKEAELNSIGTNGSAKVGRGGKSGGEKERLEAGEEMMRDTWKLWIRLLYWDEDGMSESRRKEGTAEAMRAWKNWCEWTQMESYSEVHSLLYELIHHITSTTCNVATREWIANTDSLIASHMDAQSFTSTLAILQVRNKVLDPKDPTFTNIMLEYFPHLAAHPEIKLVEARTRLILFDIYISNGHTDLAIEKLSEIEECLRADGEMHPGEEGRGVDLRWLVRFHKICLPSVHKSHKMSDSDKLAKLSALAHEAVNRDIPRFQLKALQQLAIIFLRNRDFTSFVPPETEFVVKGQKYGQPARMWRRHLKQMFENFPAPEHSQAEEFLDSFTRIMESVEWGRDSEKSGGGGGVIGSGLGLVVWTGVAEMTVGIEEFWKSKAKRLVEKIKAEEGTTGSKVDKDGLSKGLRRLWDEN
ncbi:hypothetical protein TWF569_006116 [Orbilia oligospora]|uniref:Uncharacterized protein n=2 Tax=Orbilia oligospora TaxID=2813651 RepID=A0A7C8JC76_ORBOL|nr:hypothetical protein TWF102_003433 [Orbilia oligospora]KAF3104725.1 hypothetical protein TWF706_004506 [Orbilia oligospora]KAF3115422.1 hypothetical protein TWF103_010846 [Orbilia oligospora]KAF3115423.1 hypothetical protein TWF103_010846 [Orbilia oligospora]KAF3139745.1 hypothetical protein TWF594_006606 [Orbilia oligospora]